MIYTLGYDGKLKGLRAIQTPAAEVRSRYRLDAQRPRGSGRPRGGVPSSRSLRRFELLSPAPSGLPGTGLCGWGSGGPFSKSAWLPVFGPARSSWPSTARNSLVSLKTKLPHPELLAKCCTVLLGARGRDFRSSLWGRCHPASP